MQRLLPLIRDIRFWIIFFFLIRLYGIDFPPLETGHNWRQATVNMVARNFLEESANIFYPRVDMAGAKSGITGMEFPLLNYLIYLVSTVFGWEHWYGRAINLLVSSAGIYYFYRIIKKLFDAKLALYASLILLSSVWFAFSRKIMPDTFACSLLLIGTYYGIRYLEKGLGLPGSFACGGFICLGVLAKLPAGFLLVPFLPLLFSSSYPLARRQALGTIAILPLLPPGAWYFYWVPHLTETYAFWHFAMGKELGTGIQELLNNWQQVLKRFYSSAMKFIGFFCCLGGLVLGIHRREKKLLIPVAIGTLAFLLFMAKAGNGFSKHDYYVVPFVPVMALLAAYLLTRIRPTWVGVVLLAGILVEGVANQWHSFHLDEKHRLLRNLESDMDRISSEEDLIMINSGDQPMPMYFAHRKGWLASNEEIRKARFLRKRIEKGCEYLLVLKRSFGKPMTPPLGTKELDKGAYSIYRLPRDPEKKKGAEKKAL
ncbi:MAG: ArnT family glycosyltransferase [Flavobacteriales bacterium]